MSRFELKKQFFNNKIKRILQLVFLAVVLFLLFAHTIAMGIQAMSTSATIENIDFNRFVSNINLLNRVLFDVSPLLYILYTIAKIAVSLIIIPLFIYLFFGFTTMANVSKDCKSLTVKSTTNNVFDVVYITQSKFLC